MAKTLKSAASAFAALFLVLILLTNSETIMVVEAQPCTRASTAYTELCVALVDDPLCKTKCVDLERGAINGFCNILNVRVGVATFGTCYCQFTC
ncbi:hypothetical protein QYF36_013570 [Acer negundo]|nr:hypothetical protein QYF36_000256 [Acer negundo]KAK4835720.1 hypothetical protein QYF36_013570 [Acer negundo]